MAEREYRANKLPRTAPARLTDEDYAIWYPETKRQQGWRDFRLRVLSMQLDRADGEKMFALTDAKCDEEKAKGVTDPTNRRDRR